eukprot:gene4209-4626_t
MSSVVKPVGIDLIAGIRQSCSFVVDNASSVHINETAIDSLMASTSGDFSTHLQTLIEKKNEWDATGWHYNEDILSGGELTAQYILIVDALNFCFWPCPGLEYEHLAMGLKEALLKDKTAFDAANLMVVTEETISQWIPNFTIPQLSQRVDRVREVGITLAAEYDGKVANLVRAANHSAVRLVDLVTRSFPGFRDTAIYKGHLVHFYKRAQIFVADLWGAFGRPTDPNHPYFFYDIDQVTMFADYRVPQILQHIGVLSYSSGLMKKVLDKEEIAFGSEEEIELRAATIMAVEKMKAVLNTKRNLRLTSIELDWILWNWGEQVKDDIAPHHRTLTIYY